MSYTSRSSQSAPRQRSQTERTSSGPRLSSATLTRRSALRGERAELVDHLERALGVAVLDRGDVGEVVEVLAGRVAQPGEHVVALARGAT